MAATRFTREEERQLSNWRAELSQLEAREAADKGEAQLDRIKELKLRIKTMTRSDADPFSKLAGAMDACVARVQDACGGTPSWGGVGKRVDALVDELERHADGIGLGKIGASQPYWAVTMKPQDGKGASKVVRVFARSADAAEDQALDTVSGYAPVSVKRLDAQMCNIADDNKTKIGVSALKAKFEGMSYDKLHAALKDPNVDEKIKKHVEKELDERASSGRRERG